MKEAQTGKIVLIIVVVLAIFSIVFILTRYQKIPETSIESTAAHEVILPSDTSLQLSLCSQKTDAEKVNCYTDIAIKNRNASFCYSNITDIPQCISKLVESVSESKDPKICNKDAYCIVVFAKTYGDSKVCESLSGEEAIAACKNEI